MVAEKSPRKVKKPSGKIPDFLIAEVMDGKPLYYNGYQQVLSGEKSFEEIMGSSSLQSFIVTYLVMLLGKHLDENIYTILASEAGIHLDKRNNLAGDILIFDAEVLPITSLDEHYVGVPPKITIEVDINIAVENMNLQDYMYRKTKKLLEFGVEKVIWVTTASKKVLVATQGEDWTIKDWDKAIEILPDVTFNIGQYLKDKGSKFA
jgi:Uma2 family endonuclease